MSQNVLRLDNITMQFGGVVAVDNLSLEVNEGEIVALIGPNGAGKTTAFNSITGVYEPTNGQVSFMGEPIVRNHPQGKMKQNYKGKEAGKFVQMPVLDPTPDRITKLGMARTFQNIRLFKSETVYNNVLTACHAAADYNIFQSLWRLKVGPKWLTKYYYQEKALREKTEELLKIMGIWEQRDMIAVNLPYGQQRKLEIARALATNMKLLLLDEPAAGMNPTETAELLSCINTIRDTFHVAILLIEHDMSLVMRVCERIQVINFGQTIAAGLPAEIASNQEVIEAYLGEEEADDDAED